MQRKKKKSGTVLNVTTRSGWISRQTLEETATHNDMTTLSYIAKRVTSTTSSRPDPIKAKDGTLLSDSEMKLVRWAEHICEVLNQPELTNPTEPKDPESILPITLDDFKEEQVWNAIKVLKNNKSAGANGITAKMLKAGGDEAFQWLCQMCNQVWTSGVVPKDWKDRNVICIPKGNLAKCDSWRGITLLSVMGKVYCQILLN